MRNPLSRLINRVRHIWRLKTMPLRLEFVLTDHCNLNCRGCTHYSPLAPKEFESLQALEASATHLGKVCGTKVKKAYLIGGETLLYPNLNEAMEILARNFPDSRLYIFTNGLLIPRLDEKTWQTIHRLGFVLAITRYPVKFDYDAAIELCRLHGVETEIFGDRSMADSFFRYGLDPRGGQDGRNSHFRCHNRGCISIIGNRLYPCSISACVGHLNKVLPPERQFRHRPGDWLEVDKITSAAQILRLRDRPVPFCNYCIYPPGSVKYGPSRRDPAEWTDAD